MEISYTYEEGLRIVNENYVQRVISYLETKVSFSNHENYIKCYSYINLILIL